MFAFQAGYQFRLQWLHPLPLRKWRSLSQNDNEWCPIHVVYPPGTPNNHFFNGCLVKQPFPHVKIWFIIQLKQRPRKPCESVRLVEEVCGVIGSSSSSTKSQSPNLEPTLQTRQTAGSELPPVGKQKKHMGIIQIEKHTIFGGRKCRDNPGISNSKYDLCRVFSIYVKYNHIYIYLQIYNICILFKSITMLIILQLKPLLTPNHVVFSFPSIPPVDGCIDCLHEVCGRMTFQDRQPLTNHM